MKQVNSLIVLGLHALIIDSEKKASKVFSAHRNSKPYTGMKGEAAKIDEESCEKYNAALSDEILPYIPALRDLASSNEKVKSVMDEYDASQQSKDPIDCWTLLFQVCVALGGC